MLSHGFVVGFFAERLRRRQVEGFWKGNHVFWDALYSRSVCPGFPPELYQASGIPKRVSLWALRHGDFRSKWEPSEFFNICIA
jgi:hypothetical protein